MLFDRPILARVMGSMVFDVLYPFLQNGKMTTADIVNLSIDIMMDAMLSTSYVNLFDSSNRIYNRTIATMLSSAIDSGIDIVQTAFIYNLNIRILSKANYKSSVESLYIVSYNQ